MTPRNLLADISRQFFKDKKIYSYRMRKVEDMTDDEVVRFCHWFCEDNRLTEEFNDFRDKIESQYNYCLYLNKYIEPSSCTLLQTVAEGISKQSVSYEIKDKSELKKCCSECLYCL